MMIIFFKKWLKDVNVKIYRTEAELAHLMNRKKWLEKKIEEREW